MIVSPRMTEKAYALSHAGTYVFSVPMSANKAEVARQIETQFSVKVSDVRLAIRKGKTVAASRGKRRSPGVASKADTKKAFVRLKDGQTLDLFKEEEEKK